MLVLFCCCLLMLSTSDCVICKKKKKKLKRTCWLYKKNLFDVFVVKHVSGNTRILIGPDLNLGTRITLTSV